MKFKSDIEAQAAIRDASNSPGTANQILSSTVSGTAWINPGAIGGGYLPLSAGSGYPLTGDLYGTNAFFTGNIGIGTTVPAYLLDLYKSTSTTSSTTGTTLQRLWNYVGSDLQQQKTFVDFVFQDNNDNEYPQVRIGAEVGQNGNADSQEKEGSGAFVVYTNDATGTTPGTPTDLAERFRVDYQGNVGIGTTNPSVPLEVNVTGNNGVFKFTRDTGTNGALSLGFGSAYSDFNSEQGGYVFSTQGTEKVRIETGGNVGIGTTSPDTKFHVVAGSEGEVAQFTGAIENRGLSISIETTSDGASAMTAFNSQSGSTARGQFDFRSDGTSRMIIDRAGNVGIGTTSPDYKLDVEGSANNADIGIRINNTFDDNDPASNPTSVLFLNAASNNGYLRVHGAPANTAAKHQIDLGSSAGSSFLTFSPNGGERMRIAADGNVGIGTTAPGRTLDVRGDAQILATASTGLRIVGGNTSEVYMIFGDADDHSMGGFAYNNNTNELSVDVNNSEAIRINSSGNVGIGTTAPAYKFAAYGSNVNSEIVASFGSANDQNEYTAIGLSGFIASNGATKAGLALKRTATYGVGELHFLNNNTSDNSDMTLSDSKMVILGNGNVGVGTTSPDSNLEISQNTGATIRLTSSDNFAAAGEVVGSIDFVSKDYNYTSQPIKAQIQAVINSSVGNSDLIINTTLDANKLERMRITSAGAIQFNSYGAGTLVTDASGNITVSSGGGAGGPYLPLAGGTLSGSVIQNGGNIDFSDGRSANFGNGDDLQIFHNGSNSHIETSSTSVGDFFVTARGTNHDLYLEANDNIYLRPQGNENGIIVVGNGAVQLYHDNVQKFVTTSTGVTVTGAATATTFLGDLNGTINTVTTAVTKANATNDTTVATTAFVQNLIGTIPAGLVFQGTWNAATNTPTLTSGSGTTGNFYIVSTSGSTNLDGVTDWVTGDWAVFIEQGATDAWEKIDNSSVLDGAGTGQTVALWDGSGTSNTLTDAPITVSGNNTTFAGNVTLTKSVGDTELLIDADTNNNNENYNPRLHLRQDGGAISAYFGLNGDAGNTFTGALANSAYIRAAGSIQFANGSSTDLAMTIDTSQRVGIGAAAPDAKLVVKDDSNVVYDASAYQKTFRIENKNSEGDDQFANIRFSVTGYEGQTTAEASIGVVQTSNVSSGNLVFGTRNNGTRSEKMRIAANGNVGIGTTNPQVELHVKGNNGWGEVRVEGQTFASGHGGALEFYSEGTALADVYANTSKDLILRTNGSTERMRITAAGNVGIGATSPENRLQVNGAVYSTIGMYSDHSYSGNRNWAIVTNAFGAASWGGLAIKTSTAPGLTPSTTRFGIDYLGNVGIGTSSPERKLHVFAGESGGAASNTQSALVLENSTNTYLQFLTPATSESGILFGDTDNDRGALTYSHSSDAMSFRVAASTKMTILSGGNVGIGVSDPAAKLEVKENLYVSHPNAEEITFRLDNYGATGTDAGSLLRMVNQAGFTTVNIDSRSGSTRHTYFNGGGNVGIGTTAPGVKLTTQGASGFPATSGTTQTHGALRIQDGSTAVVDFGVTGGNAAWLQSTNSGSLGTSYNFAINPNGGNVGIGTTNPIKTLDVRTDLGVLIKGATGTVDAKISFLPASGGRQYDLGNVGADFRILDASANVTRMYFDNTGDTGIGTTAPQSKLQVAGGIQMADDTDAAAAAKVGTMRYRTGTEYVEVTGVELLPNLDLTNWTSIGSTTTITADTFTTVTSAGGVRKLNFLTVGQVYRAVISGTTTTTNNQINNYSNNSNYKSWSGAGAFNFTFTFTATADTGMYLRLYSGTAEIYSFSVMEVTAEDASYADMCMQTGASTYEWVNIVRNTY